MHGLKFRATLAKGDKVIDVAKIDFINKKIEYIEGHQIKVIKFEDVKQFEYVKNAYRRILYFKN